MAAPFAAPPSLEQELEVSLPAGGDPGGYGCIVSSCLERRWASWRRVWALSAVL